MPNSRIILFTALAMMAFAGNSLLSRVALTHTAIDASSFVTIRLVSGAAMLWLIVQIRRGARPRAGSWPSAFALFAYAAAFSYAYLSLPTGTGALLLFGAVQATMVGRALWIGERLRSWQAAGLALAFGGLTGLFLPGLAAPPLLGSVLMMAAGVAWGIYSLRGQKAGDPTDVSAGNFLRAAPLAALFSACTFGRASWDGAGFLIATASGALTSALGYIVWYSVLPRLKATSAATVQLSVPVLAALGGILFLGEALTLRLVLASAAILGGIALVILAKPRRTVAPETATTAPVRPSGGHSSD